MASLANPIVPVGPNESYDITSLNDAIAASTGTFLDDPETVMVVHQGIVETMYEQGHGILDTILPIRYSAQQTPQRYIVLIKEQPINYIAFRGAEETTAPVPVFTKKTEILYGERIQAATEFNDFHLKTETGAQLAKRLIMSQAESHYLKILEIVQTTLLNQRTIFESYRPEYRQNVQRSVEELRDLFNMRLQHFGSFNTTTETIHSLMGEIKSVMERDDIRIKCNSALLPTQCMQRLTTTLVHKTVSRPLAEFESIFSKVPNVENNVKVDLKVNYWKDYLSCFEFVHFKNPRQKTQLPSYSRYREEGLFYHICPANDTRTIDPVTEWQIIIPDWDRYQYMKFDFVMHAVNKMATTFTTTGVRIHDQVFTTFQSLLDLNDNETKTRYKEKLRQYFIQHQIERFPENYQTYENKTDALKKELNRVTKANISTVASNIRTGGHVTHGTRSAFYALPDYARYIANYASVLGTAWNIVDRVDGAQTTTDFGNLLATAKQSMTVSRINETNTQMWIRGFLELYFITGTLNPDRWLQNDTCQAILVQGAGHAHENGLVTLAMRYLYPCTNNAQWHLLSGRKMNLNELRTNAELFNLLHECQNLARVVEGLQIVANNELAIDAVYLLVWYFVTSFDWTTTDAERSDPNHVGAINKLFTAIFDPETILDAENDHMGDGPTTNQYTSDAVGGKLANGDDDEQRARTMGTDARTYNADLLRTILQVFSSVVYDDGTNALERVFLPLALFMYDLFASTVTNNNAQTTLNDAAIQIEHANFNQRASTNIVKVSKHISNSIDILQRPASKVLDKEKLANTMVSKFLNTTPTPQNISSTIRSGVPQPYGVRLCRPNVIFEADAAIFCQAGPEFGETHLWNMQVYRANAIEMERTRMYSHMHMIVAIYDHKRCIVVPDVSLVYVAGMGCKLYSDFAAYVKSVATYGNGIRKNADMIVMLTSLQDSTEIQHIVMSGRFDQRHHLALVDETKLELRDGVRYLHGFGHLYAAIWDRWGKDLHRRAYFEGDGSMNDNEHFQHRHARFQNMICSGAPFYKVNPDGSRGEFRPGYCAIPLAHEAQAKNTFQRSMYAKIEPASDVVRAVIV